MLLPSSACRASSHWQTKGVLQMLPCGDHPLQVDQEGAPGSLVCLSLPAIPRSYIKVGLTVHLWSSDGFSWVGSTSDNKHF